MKLKKTKNVQKCAWPSRLLSSFPRHLREPVVKASEQGEDQPTHDRVVEVGHHEKAPVNGHINGDIGEEYTSDPADEEVEQHPEAEEHRNLEADLRFPQCPERHEIQKARLEWR